MSYAWRATTIANGHTVITRWEGHRIWGSLDTRTPSAPQLAEAFGRAIWAWSNRATPTPDRRV